MADWINKNSKSMQEMYAKLDATKDEEYMIIGDYTLNFTRQIVAPMGASMPINEIYTREYWIAYYTKLSNGEPDFKGYRGVDRYGNEGIFEDFEQSIGE